jgi:hypothetical protein
VRPRHALVVSIACTVAVIASGCDGKEASSGPRLCGAVVVPPLTYPALVARGFMGGHAPASGFDNPYCEAHHVPPFSKVPRTLVAGEACSIDGFCSYGWPPTANGLTALFAPAADDVWAVGHAGTILHFDGASWRAVRSATGFNLNAIAGSSSTDIWAAGDGGPLVHWDGRTWTAVRSATEEPLIDLTVRSARDAWAVSAHAAFHWDGTTWSLAADGLDPNATLLGVWGGRRDEPGSTDEVWAVASSAGTAEPTPADGSPRPSHLLRWDGGRWSMTDVPFDLRAVRGTRRGDVYATGYGTLHFDGTCWSQIATPVAPSGVGAFAVTNDSELVLGTLDGVVSGGGAKWSPQLDACYSLASLASPQHADTWGVGYGAESTTLLHYDGAAWSDHTQLDDEHRLTAVAMAGSGPKDVWASDANGTYRHWDGVEWKRVDVPGAVLPLAANDAWAVGDTAVFRWNGSTWTNVPTAPIDATFLSSDSRRMLGIAGTSASDVWLMTVHDYWHWDGASWSKIPGGHPGSFGKVFATSPGDLWSIDTVAGVVHHWDGHGWTSKTFASTGNLDFNLWGSGPRDVWLAGADTVSHFDGVAWNETKLYGLLTSVWGSGPDDVWLTGNGFLYPRRDPMGEGLLFHWQAKGWSRVASGTAKPILSGWASPTEVWISGDAGQMLRLRR